MNPQILVAGIGNIFLGDDAFGVEVVKRLAAQNLPPEVEVVDFGINGLDLTYALLDGYAAVILVDAIPRGQTPGTLYVIEPEAEDTCADESADVLIETHSLNPAKVLRIVRRLGGRIDRLLLVGCEPSPVDVDDMHDGLSDAVAAAVDGSVKMVLELIEKTFESDKDPGSRSSNKSLPQPNKPLAASRGNTTGMTFLNDALVTC
jgi:hydrogenase maturation protease